MSEDPFIEYDVEPGAPKKGRRQRPPRPSRDSATNRRKFDSLKAPATGRQLTLEEHFANRNYTPWPFQVRAWEAFLRGESGLIHVPTGSGKTLAAFGGPLKELRAGEGLQILYVSPLRAVVRDIQRAVYEVVKDVCPGATVETRTGDTSNAVKARQRTSLPEILLTTPESLSLMLSREDFGVQMGNLRAIILDEWHELMNSKRGVQVELAVSHLLPRLSKARVWAMSGTIANLEEAAHAAVGKSREAHVISEEMNRPVTVESVLPEDPLAISWAGHMGREMMPHLLKRLDETQATLIFVNTRAQAELWFQAILEAKPEMAGAIALHHGSLDPETREFVESGVKNGTILWVVCTSSLDLGVDFGPVEKVVQIGSPKGIARLMQRAGRASHRPNTPCEILFVPTHAMEAAEIAAVRRALARKEIEARPPFSGAIDVLEQHVVTLACAEWQDVNQIFSEVRQTKSYETLSREVFDWILQHLTTGGEALTAYPQFHKIVRDGDLIRVVSPMIARQHRLSIGTIVSDATMQLVYVSRRKIGTIEEHYISRFKAGDRFLFAGKVLEFVRIHDMKAFVKPGKGKVTQTPRWMGGRLPISPTLSHELRRVIADCAEGRYPPQEEFLLRPLFTLQAEQSRLPRENELLIEVSKSREGEHCFIYPFEGRLVHEGLASILALRIGRMHSGTFGLSVNDYGIELVSEEPFGFAVLFRDQFRKLFAEERLLEDLAESIALGEYSKRHFREIARVSGLIFQGYPGASKSMKQVQMSSGLIYEVLRKYEPGNQLLSQAEREVLERQFEWHRMSEALTRIHASVPAVQETARFSPLAFPLVFERMSARMSTETILQRVEKMKQRWLERT